MAAATGPLAPSAAATTIAPAAETSTETTQPAAPGELELVEVEAATIEREANDARDRVAQVAYVLLVLGALMVVFTIVMFRATKPMPAALKNLTRLRPGKGR